MSESFDPGFPVHIFRNGMQLPQEGTYFVLAGNGCWMHKDTGLVSCFVPVEQISFLDEIDARAWVHCRLPKIPHALVYRVRHFFARVVAMQRTEANVVLYYNKQTNQYKVLPTDQSVSLAGVEYKRKGVTEMEGMEGYLRVGTIHSHCDFDAFHSGTDIGDERDFDGLHVTFGHNDRENITISASVVVNEHRMRVDPLSVLAGIEPLAAVNPPPGPPSPYPHSRDAHYKITEPAPEVAATWLEGMDSWLALVKRPSLWERLHSNEDLAAGTKVVWSDTLNVEKWKGMFGEGPFNVQRNEGDKVVIETVAGLARFSKKVFKKCQEDQGTPQVTVSEATETTEAAEAVVVEEETSKGEQQ